MDYFPIFTKLEGRHCLVIGAGEVATRKIELLLQAMAQVIVIAPEVCSTIQSLALHHSNLKIIQKSYDSSFLTNVYLVIAATNNREVNQQVYQDAEQHKIFANVVDTPELCSFITPAIVDRAPITIAISSGGKAPVLARLIRGKLESMIPAAYGKLGKLAEKFRERVKQTLKTGTERKNFWEDIFEGATAEAVFANKDTEAEQQLTQLLNQYKFKTQSTPGEVYLIGAGPGDPDLLTFKALRLMQKADIVVYDRLVSKSILNLVRRDAQKLYVGKQRAKHCVPQGDINKKLIEFAQQGKRVVRLKGGDPYIFGRGGEEAQALVKAGISFQVIPGITSAAGASTFCGIPLTHRDYAQSVTFATGHLKNGTVDLNWQALAQTNNTLVIYMGLTGLKTITKELIAHGLKSKTSVAVIQNATRFAQKVAIGSLETIVKDVKQKQIESPAIIIIGDVVKMYNELNKETLDLEWKVASA
ncbi:siroheme synthase CysG [Pleionea sediminis]|uniref:siroheme synthase CysG n=1 Tax=Pleionea sediminis TaxID=2569479 RepID=UPI001185D25A|nr:siroheme synthase CysG [Pleionea sediminis]